MRSTVKSRRDDYRQRLAASGDVAGQWRREAETWFDGSVESVDRRLAMCERLIAAARASAVYDGPTHRRVSAVINLETQQAALCRLRRDLLTAAADRADEKIAQHNRNKHLFGSLSAHDRRWVELESARFVRDHAGIDADELATRARHHAQVVTSTLTAERSRQVTSAFVAATGTKRRPPARTAAAAPVVDAPGEWLFL